MTNTAATRPFDVMLGVPSDCTGSFAGCQFMPAALRAAGVADALGVTAPRTTIVGDAQLTANPAQHTLETRSTLAVRARGFWLHVDLDVLSSDELPAVDYPDPRGLSFAQLREVLAPVFASPDLIGASVVILNPTLDPPGRDSAASVVKLLADALA